MQPLKQNYQNEVYLEAVKNSPVHEDVFEKRLLADADKANDVFAGIDGALKSNEYIGTYEVAFRIAAKALKIIEDTSYRNWTENVEDGIALWARTVWRFCFAAPLGYMVQSNVVYSTKNTESWDPVRQNFGSHSKNGGAKMKPSNRRLNPDVFGAATALRIFGDTYQYSGIMQGQAFIDAFDSKGSRDNPIRNAFKRSFGNVIEQVGFENLTPWWKECAIAYSVIEDESQNLAREKINNEAKEAGLPYIEKREVDIKPAPVDTPEVRSKESPKLNDGKSKANEVVETNNVATLNPVQENKPAKTESEVDDGLHNKYDTYIKSMAYLPNAFNVAKATFHIVDDEIYINPTVVSKKWADENGVSSSKALAIFEKEGAIINNLVQFNVIPEGKVVAKMKLLKLGEQLHKDLEQVVNQFGNNEDLEKVVKE